jgi:hypothetical protein
MAVSRSIKALPSCQSAAWKGGGSSHDWLPHKRVSGGHVLLIDVCRGEIFADSVGFGTLQTLSIDGDDDFVALIALDLALFATHFFGYSTFLRFEPTLG